MAQWNKHNQDYLNQERSLFEVFNVATSDGEQVTFDNPFPVSLGSSSITINGDITIPGSVEINNDEGNPIPISKNTSINSDINPIFVKGTSDTSFFAPTQTDAFGRLRVSEPLTLFDSSHRYRDNNLWDESIVGASSTVGFSTTEGLINMTIGTGSADSIIRETTKVFSYQPGKSLLVLNTFVPESPKQNLRQRVGYFGADNGIYFEIDGDKAYFVERSLSTGTETRISQENWDHDKLDGTGESGLTLNLSRAQILWMDIEWLGLGTVRVGFVINGRFIVCHTFDHSNLIQSTYMTTASLPLRFEISNTGITTSPSTLKQVCSSVISEGGYELRGLQQAVNTSIISPVELPAPAGTHYPVISIRLKSTPNRLDAIVILTALSLMGSGNGPKYTWQMRASGTTTGGTWISAGVDSAVEYKIGGTSISGGRILASGFFSSTNQAQTTVNILKEALFKFQLERNGLTGTPYELTLTCASDTAGADVFASIDWEEISR